VGGGSAGGGLGGAPPLSGVRVAVLMGGPSREHGVSVMSGAAVLAALAAAGAETVPVRIGLDGTWSLPGPGHLPLPGADSAAAPAASALVRLGSAAVDVVFVALHGPHGEDGTVQGLLETAAVAYTGSGVSASALAMDKERAKEVLVHHGLSTPPWLSVDRRTFERDPAAFEARVAASLGYPAVVKPPREGSSFGVVLAHDADGLLAGVREALATPDGRALVERRVLGTEVTCPVLGNRGGDLATLPLVEVVPRGRELFDFAAKYEGHSEEVCPARVPADVAERVRAAALTAHRVLGCDGMSRSDFIVPVGAGGEPWYLETNTVPGMTLKSLCPLSARAAGMDLPALCTRLVALALERSRAARAAAGPDNPDNPASGLHRGPRTA
jgi:D-alanine-D-alanine ligase